MRDDRVRRTGLDEEQEQFRLLFRTFLRRLFHSDLVPDTVDLRQSAIVLAAVLTVPPALYVIGSAWSYGSWMSDMELAMRAVPHLALWGSGLALAHTVFWILMAGVLTELLLCRFHKVPFACSYVPGKANVKLLWPVYALALTAYASWTARLELWLLGKTPLVECRLPDAARRSRHHHLLAPARSRVRLSAAVRGSRRPGRPGAGRDADLRPRGVRLFHKLCL